MKTASSVLIVMTVGLGLLGYGHIKQLAHYHDFAAHQVWLGLPHGQDVWSNLGLVIVGILLFAHLYRTPAFTGRLSACVLAAGIALTGIGSAYYHLTPNDATLIWDRLPISLICAALLACIYRYTHQKPEYGLLLIGVVVAIFGVWYWVQTGDLRWYLGLQIVTILLLPLWLWQARAPKPVYLALVWAIGFYIIAKITEIADMLIWQATHEFISGHTLKHLFATLSMYAVYLALTRMHQSDTPSANACRCLNRKFG